MKYDPESFFTQTSDQILGRSARFGVFPTVVFVCVKHVSD